MKEIDALEERFLSADDQTGKPEFDETSDGSVSTPEEEFDEVDMLMDVIQSSAINAMMCIDSVLRRGHKDKLVAMFGAEAEAVLKESKACLESVVELFQMADEEEPQEPVEEPKEPVEQPAEEPKQEPKQTEVKPEAV
jgi:hypothetical protein